MDKKINNYFCIQPFVNVTTRIGGENNVCCNIMETASNIKHQTPAEFFNSKYVSQFREKLLAGEKLDACRLCHFQEENSNSSHRMKYNEYYMINNGEDTEYYKKRLKRLRLLESTGPLYAEIHISNLCNLKCLTCNERDSSQFHAENKMLGISQEPDKDYTKFVVHSEKALVPLLKKQLLFLDIRGGETLMVPEIKKILENLSDDTAKNITLKIQTNGTILPDEAWLKIFNKFKNTKINLSIDAYGEDNHYVRYPSNWNKILETIDFLKQNKIKFIINTVVSNLNILVLDKLLRWIQENNYMNYFYILKNPPHFMPGNLPKSLLDLAKEKLQNVNKNFMNKDCNKMLADLLSLQSIGNDVLWQRFCDEISMRDKHRKNTITKVIPTIKEYMNAKV